MKIEKIWAFVAVEDAEGNEGIIATGLEGIGMTPLVCATERVREIMRPLAVDVGEAKGVKVRLLEFSTMEEIPL